MVERHAVLKCPLVPCSVAHSGVIDHRQQLQQYQLISAALRPCYCKPGSTCWS